MKQVLILFILLTIQSSLYSQDSLVIERSITQKLTDDLKIFGEDAAGFFTTPVRFSGTEWLYTAGIAGVTVLSFYADSPIKKKVGRETILSLNKDFWDIPTTYGIVGYANAFSLATYTAGLLSGNDDIRLTGRMLFEALSISGVSVMALRFVFGRIRPYYDEGPWKFYWFEKSNEIQSFPSGHTVVAFALSTVLAEQIDNIWASIGLYGIAGLTGFSRVYNNQHWFSDVATGALLGLGAGLYVINRERERSNIPADNDPEFSLYPSSNGLNLLVKF